MGKLVLYLICIVFFTILFTSRTLGDEQNQEVQDAFRRELREAGRKSGKFAKKDKNTSGSKKRKIKKKNGKEGKKVNKQKNSNAKKERKNNRNKGGKSKKKNTSHFRKRDESMKKSQNSRKSKQTKSIKNGCSRQTSEFCPAEKASSLKLLYNQVYNFKKQLKRAQSQADIVEKKRKKKDNFQKDAAILTDVVGGNLTNPTCSAKSRSASSAGSTGSTLSSCSTTIATSCETITINSTLTGTCSDTMTTFETKVTTCKASGTCACWTEAFAMKSAITKCSAVEEANSVKAKKKTCLNTFGDCKKAQDSAVEYTATCPTETSSATTMATASTTKSAKRRNIVERFLARNLMRSSQLNAIKA